MSLISKKEIEELHRVNRDYCISIFIPTHRAGKKVLQKEDALSLKIQLQDVIQKLEDEGMHKTEIDGLVTPVKQLIDDGAFWRQQSDGLAIFLADGCYKEFTVPVYFEAYNYIGRSFYLKPLMPMFVGSGNFYLMTLELGDVNLYECNRHSIAEVIVHDLIPEKIQDRMGYDYEQKNLQFRAQQALTGHVMYHGQETATGKRKNEIKKYLRAINDGIRPVLTHENAPLVMAARDYIFDIYQSVNTYANFFPENLNGNFGHVGIFDVHEWAWKKIAPVLEKRRKNKLALYWSQEGTGSTSIRIEEILLAAIEGKVDTLFCENNMDIFGKYNSDSNTVWKSPVRGKNDISLMNLAAVKTFLQGGKVYLMDKADMPDRNSKVNALYRF